ncbi:hypothetical protein RQP46_007199 [Phenoliferia psychrophenolica]
MSIAINSPDLPFPPPYFSHSVLVPEQGQTLYLAGQCGMVDGLMIPGTVQDRTRKAIENIKTVLAASGMTLKDVVSATVYLSNYRQDFTPMNETYIECFKCTGQPVPARACVGVAILPRDTDVEIQCIARRGPA